jgi:hypothetical protein
MKAYLLKYWDLLRPASGFCRRRLLDGAGGPVARLCDTLDREGCPVGATGNGSVPLCRFTTALPNNGARRAHGSGEEG